MSELIKLQGIYKKYYGNQVLKNFSITIPEGRMIGLLGNNGVGKTTLLRLLANIVYADKGNISFNNQQGKNINIKDISFLLEEENFYSWMKVKDAIEYYKDFFEDFDWKRAFQLCEESGLRLESRIARLSQGNIERLSFLLTLCRKVKLYLLDEPMGGLDPAFKKDIKRFLLSNIPEGATVIMATHLLKDLEVIFDQIIIMKPGEIIYADTEEIREKQHQSVEEYYLEVIENVQHNEMGI